MSVVNIVIQGICGRMGRTLDRIIAERNDCKIVAGIDHVSSDDFAFPLFQSVEQLDSLGEKADVIIDFSLPEATFKALDYCAQKQIPCVVCTTGFEEEMREKIAVARQKTAVFYGANMSLGVNLLAELARRAQAVLPGFDIEIVEKHHRNKLDAPSGTAIFLADEINEQADGRYEYVHERHSVRQKRGDNELGISAVRGGSIVGEHDIIFAGTDEVLTLSHSAYSRDIFAIGAVAAALFVVGKAPGHYNMKNMMEMI